MEIIEVEAFVAVAEHGNFTRAAEALFISQPAISRRIELLERELSAPLFERSRSGATLTDAGEAFLPFARQVLAGIRDGTAAIQEMHTGERGTVALALVGTLASTELTTRLKSFRDASPDVRLSLRTARSDDVSALVQTGAVALGLRYFADESAAIVSEHISDEQLVVVCAGDSRFGSLVDSDPNAWAGAQWVSFPAGSGSSGEPFHRRLEQLLARLGLTGAEIIAIDSLTAQKRLIEADFGLGLLPASSITEELRLGTLRVLEIPGAVMTVPVFVIRRRAGYLSPAARRLLQSLTSK